MSRLSPRELIAKRLRAAREQAGLSQGQIAAKLGMKRPTISEIEAGRRRVSAEEIARFSNLYDVAVQWLVSGEANATDPAVELAARELAKLKSEDLESVLRLLQTIRRTGDKR